MNNTIGLLLWASTAAALGQTQTQTMYQSINSTFAIDIVALLQQDIEFKNFVFYVSPRLSHDSETATTIINDFWRRFPLMPVIIITENVKSMVGLLDRPTLCFIMTTKWNDPVLDVVSKSLAKQRYFRTIFLYFPLAKSPSLRVVHEEIRLLYHWVWARRFLNTVLITVNNNLYLYDAYPTGVIINKTGDWQATDLFRQQPLNLKGWEIKTPVRKDVPRVFCMQRFPHKKRDTMLSGTSGKLFAAFVKYINGSLNEAAIQEHELEPFESQDLLKMVEDDDGEIEISVHSYTSIKRAAVDTSYPIGINDWCLMVPFRNSSDNMFLRRSFQQSGWLLLGLAGLYITVGIWLCTPPPERDLSLSFLQTICSLLLIQPQRILILPHRRVRFMFMLLFVTGFCLTNIYLSKMATHLTAAKDEKQMETLRDISDAKLHIMISHDDYKTLSNLNVSAKLKQLLTPAEERVVVAHREGLNTSYGYAITSDRWYFFNKRQEFLTKPLFLLTKICVGPFYHVFPLQSNSDLTQPFMEFIMDVHQSGLNLFWKTEVVHDAQFLGYISILKSDDQLKSLSIQFFYPIFHVWLFGLVLSALAFVWETRRKTIAGVRRILKKKGHKVVNESL